MPWSSGWKIHIGNISAARYISSTNLRFTLVISAISESESAMTATKESPNWGTRFLETLCKKEENPPESIPSIREMCLPDPLTVWEIS
jgi:hypothetical protein